MSWAFSRVTQQSWGENKSLQIPRHYSLYSRFLTQKTLIIISIVHTKMQAYKMAGIKRVTAPEMKQILGKKITPLKIICYLSINILRHIKFLPTQS